MSWRELFERTPDGVTVDTIAAVVSERRSAHGSDEHAESTASEPAEPSPARVVADADVLAAACCLDDSSRIVLDTLYQHSWTTLVASDELLADTVGVIEAVADRSLAIAWREQIEAWRQPVKHPASDHPALGSAYRGGAMHVLSFDDELTSSAAGATLNNRASISVRQPAAFELLFDPASLYEAEHDEAYPGPDRPSQL